MLFKTQVKHFHDCNSDFVLCLTAAFCSSHWDDNGHHHESFQCGTMHCCGGCNKKYCCSEQENYLSQEDCPERECVPFSVIYRFTEFFFLNLIMLLKRHVSCVFSSWSSNTKHISLPAVGGIVSVFPVVFCVALVVCFVCPCCMLHQRCCKRRRRHQQSTTPDQFVQESILKLNNALTVQVKLNL